MKIGIYDGATEENIVRDMTDDEKAEREADIQAHLDAKAALELEATAKAEAKAALLDRLGITSDEAALLFADANVDKETSSLA
jgi:hypothetical protein